jgi:hypothetical protein
MRIDVVNLMAFDYYDGRTTDMGTAAIASANAVNTLSIWSIQRDPGWLFSHVLMGA